jgi:hypothetical protein
MIGGGGHIMLFVRNKGYLETCPSRTHCLPTYFLFVECFGFQQQLEKGVSVSLLQQIMFGSAKCRMLSFASGCIRVVIKSDVLPDIPINVHFYNCVYLFGQRSFLSGMIDRFGCGVFFFFRQEVSCDAGILTTASGHSGHADKTTS